MIILKILWAHVVFSLFNFLFYELVKNIFGQRILDNGWRETAEYKEFQEANPKHETYNAYADPMYYLVMLIPFFNVLCTYDLIDMILHEPTSR